MRFRVTIAVLVVLAVVVTGGVLVAAPYVFEEDAPEAPEAPIISFWGDSIAEGVLGASPVNERESNCYYAIVGRSNGFTYYNRSVSGHKTEAMLEFIQRPDDGASMNATILRTSDIIHISILGNDLLQNYLGSLVMYYPTKDPNNSEYRRLLDLLDTASKNFTDIIDYIARVNPTATIMVSTVYNPMFPGSKIIGSNVVDYMKRTYGFDDAGVRASTNELLGDLNAVIFDYAEANPGVIEIVDVAAAFEEIYQQDISLNKALFYNDGVHPSNKGHAVIARAIQEKLEALGIAGADALGKYRALRLDEVQRVYPSVSSAAFTELAAADSFSAVTETYFDLTDGLTPDYIKEIEPDPDQRHFDTQTEFYLTDDCAVWNMPIFNIIGSVFGEDNILASIELFDRDNCKIVFYPDGRVRMQFYLVDGIGTTVMPILNSMLQNVELPDFDVQGGLVDSYASELFPGFTLSDWVGSMEKLKGALGLEIVGIDWEQPALEAFMAELSETGMLPDKFPAGLVLTDPFGIVYEGTYYMETVHSDVTNTDYTAIYTGKAAEGGQPYLVGTLTTDEDGESNIVARIEFLQFVIAASTTKSK